MRTDEDGFTLVEILVVMLIIGVLAAIALPTFLGQRDKARDAEAKSNARNLVSHVETCFALSEDYRQCQNTQLTPTGLPLSGTDGATPVAGQVSVEDTPTANEFTVAARSKDDTLFRITRDAHGYTRTCTPDGNGCKAGGW